MTRVHETVHGRGLQIWPPKSCRARWPRSGLVRGVLQRGPAMGSWGSGSSGPLPRTPSTGPTAPRSFPPLTRQEHSSSGGPDLSSPQRAAVPTSVPGREHSHGSRSHAPRRAGVSDGFLSVHTCLCARAQGEPGGSAHGHVDRPWGPQVWKGLGAAVPFRGAEQSGPCGLALDVELVKTRRCLPSGVPSPTGPTWAHGRVSRRH